MKLSAEQIKGRIRNIAKENSADARALIRMYMMERFLERASVSAYKDNIIVKGGFLVTAMVGVNMRSTMDIDASIKNINLSMDDAKKMIADIASIELDDGITFVVKDAADIMDDADYPGIRIYLDALIDRIKMPFKVDISTGDIITPAEIQYDYKLLLEDRSVTLWSYNIETLLSEKIQTVLSRGVLNTRMRDFYDIYMLQLKCRYDIDYEVLAEALNSTCNKRGTPDVLNDAEKIIYEISNDTIMRNRWDAYRRKYDYASGISIDMVLDSVKKITWSSF
ncbi:MAG: nucleotidyl transferase AbiEii/AbiGii toxin family protein [Clostridiales bacterium]|nr:nucleotidyl transferase AbiEii/AbiGii toxin family protein [Candidatus Crickella caballi]